ncbi:hypothetical protein [Escherichia coli]|uniref:hypothetical protein n=1 Tax=Escherichia coli TaxID=562 RepID=UPI0012FFDF2A|nr:hypothetical protein [Escherichia coli]
MLILPESHSVIVDRFVDKLFYINLSVYNMKHKYILPLVFGALFIRVTICNAANLVQTSSLTTISNINATVTGTFTSQITAPTGSAVLGSIMMCVKQDLVSYTLPVVLSSTSDASRYSSSAHCPTGYYGWRFKSTFSVTPLTSGCPTPTVINNSYFSAGSSPSGSCTYSLTSTFTPGLTLFDLSSTPVPVTTIAPNIPSIITTGNPVPPVVLLSETYDTNAFNIKTITSTHDQRMDQTEEITIMEITQTTGTNAQVQVNISDSASGPCSTTPVGFSKEDATGVKTSISWGVAYMSNGDKLVATIPQCLAPTATSSPRVDTIVLSFSIS